MLIMPWALLNVIIGLTPFFIFIIKTYCSWIGFSILHFYVDYGLLKIFQFKAHMKIKYFFLNFSFQMSYIVCLINSCDWNLGYFNDENKVHIICYKIHLLQNWESMCYLPLIPLGKPKGESIHHGIVTLIKCMFFRF
jgi:hypothetical protein